MTKAGKRILCTAAAALTVLVFVAGNIFTAVAVFTSFLLFDFDSLSFALSHCQIIAAHPNFQRVAERRAFDEPDGHARHNAHFH